MKVGSEAEPVAEDSDSNAGSNYDSAMKDFNRSGQSFESDSRAGSADQSRLNEITFGNEERSSQVDMSRRITVFPWRVHASKVVYIKNFYLFPICVSLVQVQWDFFIVRLCKFNPALMQSSIRFLVIENFLGVMRKDQLSSGRGLLREFRKAFLEHNWHEFLVHLVVMNNDTVNFNSSLGYINYIEF